MSAINSSPIGSIHEVKILGYGKSGYEAASIFFHEDLLF